MNARQISPSQFIISFVSCGNLTCVHKPITVTVFTGHILANKCATNLPNLRYYEPRTYWKLLCDWLIFHMIGRSKLNESLPCIHLRSVIRVSNPSQSAGMILHSGEPLLSENSFRYTRHNYIYFHSRIRYFVFILLIMKCNFCYHYHFHCFKFRWRILIHFTGVRDLVFNFNTDSIHTWTIHYML